MPIEFESRPRVVRQFPQAVMTALCVAVLVAAPAVAYNVQAAVADPAPGARSPAVWVWITATGNPRAAETGGRRLFKTVSGLGKVVAFDTRNWVPEGSGGVCQPASEWWCREGTE